VREVGGPVGVPESWDVIKNLDKNLDIAGRIRETGGGERKALTFYVLAQI
jgi:hypothetical protein